MVKQKSGLGRGLDALLGEYSNNDDTAITELDIRLIDTNQAQPRKSFDEKKLAELALSLKRHGMVQPIIVRPAKDRYVIVAGERRYRAARMAQMTRVPVVVKEYEDGEILEVALIENIQRENLNPIEEAAAIKFLMMHHDLTQEEVAERISKSRPSIANTLRLLSLCPAVQELVVSEALTSGHARALASIKDEALQLKIATEAVENGYTVRQMEAIAKKLQQENDEEQHKEKPKEERVVPEMRAATEALRAGLGTKVQIKGTTDRGKIIIDYFSAEELQRLYDVMAQKQ